MLHGIDLAVTEGQIVGVLGHNGMGKTTLLKTLMGIVPATSGRVEFDGVDISDEPAHERSRLGLGYVPQGRGIFPQLSVYDNLRMGVISQTNINLVGSHCGVSIGEDGPSQMALEDLAMFR